MNQETQIDKEKKEKEKLTHDILYAHVPNFKKVYGWKYNIVENFKVLDHKVFVNPGNIKTTTLTEAGKDYLEKIKAHEKDVYEFYKKKNKFVYEKNELNEVEQTKAKFDKQKLAHFSAFNLHKITIKESAEHLKELLDQLEAENQPPNSTYNVYNHSYTVYTPLSLSKLKKLYNEYTTLKENKENLTKEITKIKRAYTIAQKKKT